MRSALHGMRLCMSVTRRSRSVANQLGTDRTRAGATPGGITCPPAVECRAILPGGQVMRARGASAPTIYELRRPNRRWLYQPRPDWLLCLRHASDQN
jgi:hypothetical protein